MNELQRFLAMMEYQPADRIPNWELGVWRQTAERWAREGLDGRCFHWDWFSGEEALGMDYREFIPFSGGMIPPFEYAVLEDEGETEVIRDGQGRVRRALKRGAIGGARMSMDQYLRFPVETMEDQQQLKRRYEPSNPERYSKDWRTQVPNYNIRQAKYIGKTNRVEVKLKPGEAGLFALLPYQVSRVKISAPKVAKRGQLVAIGFTITYKPTPKLLPPKHILSVSVFDPDGIKQRHYGANLRLSGNKAKLTIPFALNDKVGQWKVTAKDVASGVSSYAKLILR